MKKITLMLIVIAMVVFAGCSKSVKDKIEGTWKVKSVEGQTLSAEELGSASMTFLADGTFKAKNQDREMGGTWTVADDEKTVTLKFKEDKDSFDEIWKIVTVTEKELVYTVGTDTEKITLFK